MKKIIKKVVSIVLTITIFLFILPSQKVFASDFDSKVDLTYSVAENGVMHIKEVRTIVNNSLRYYIKASSYETFIIPTFKTRNENGSASFEEVLKTITVKDENGNALQMSTQTSDEQIDVQVLYGSDIRRGERKVIVFEYDNYELVEKNGNVWNIYIPGMSENFLGTETSENGSVTEKSFTVSLEVNNSLGETNFVLPEPLVINSIEDRTVYNFDPKTLINQAGWLQIGDKQYYYFEIEQPIMSSTTLSSKVFYTYYDLVLPREDEKGNQSVYFTSIEPEPEYIRLDGEGNVIARFKFSSEEESSINVKGYMTARVTGEITSEDMGTLEEIDYSEVYATIDNMEITYNDLLGATTYWEADAEEIRDKAAELKGEKKSIYEILLADYYFIIENVDYDTLKTGINNQRQGALSTLLGGSSVCMEFSDLLITLLRAQGIPARAAFGYGFDPKAKSGTEEGHQWVELYSPKLGWIPVDPTWGDTGRRSYIGNDLDHALWRVASVNVETPSPVTKYSIMDDGELDPPIFKIEVVEEIPNVQMLSFDELLNQFKYTQKHELQEKIDQLNEYGKVVFIGIPSLVVFIIFISLLLSISKYFRRRRVLNYANDHSKGNTGSDSLYN